jgi:DHA1 family inner membrane transport protein
VHQERALNPCPRRTSCRLSLIFAPYFAAHCWLATISVFLIGTGVAIVPALQIRLMDVAEDAQTLAAALNHSAFNIANALGAWLGGVAIAGGLGWASTGWVGALLALAGLLIFVVSLAEEGQSARGLVSASLTGYAPK